MNNEKRIEMEKKIVLKLLTVAIEHGLWCRVNNGECDTPKSQNAEQLAKATRTTDQDYIMIYTRTSEGKFTYRGQFFLVYGNTGWDTICDYSNNYLTEMLMEAGIQNLTDTLCVCAE